MSVIEEVKQKIDIVDIVGEYAPLTKSGRNFRAVCPFHQEKTPSFFVFPEKQSWHCFGACGTGGDVFSFVMKREGIDFGEALRRLAARAGVVMPSRVESDVRKGVRDRVFQANEAAARYFHGLLVEAPQGQKAREYLNGRGLTGNSISEFKLGYALDSWDGLKSHLIERGFTEAEQLEAGLLSSSDTGRRFDRWRNRLMFPIRDERGQTTGFGARILEASTDGPKYINTPQTPIFDKSGSLYGIDMAGPEIRKQNQAIIVEGYMDVIVAHQYGSKNVVASMGTSITEKQVNTLKKLSRNVVLALDSDSAGAEAMARCVQHENALESEIRVVILPEGKDPDDVIKEDVALWLRLASEAGAVVDYVFDSVVSLLDLTRVSQRTMAREKLYPVVDGITDVVRRAHYLRKLARMLGVADADLDASMRKKSATAARVSKTVAPATKPRGDSLFRSPLEEFFLSLLLKFPELRDSAGDVPAEYFDNSENLAIFEAWRKCDGSVETLRNTLDPTVQDHLASITGNSIQPLEIRRKYDISVLRLREKYLRNLERKREALFEGESDPAVELARSKEVSAELKQVFQLKARREQGLRSG
jgi:DNA primase